MGSALIRFTWFPTPSGVQEIESNQIYLDTDKLPALSTKS
jgi:hypothetical protein